MFLVFSLMLCMVSTLQTQSSALAGTSGVANNVRQRGLGSNGWSISNGATMTGSTIFPLNTTDFLSLSVTITFSGTLPQSPRPIEFGLVNVSTGVFTPFRLYLGRSGQTANVTRAVGVPAGGDYRFRIRNTLGVAATVTGSFAVNKPANTFGGGGIGNRTFRLQRTRGSAVSDAQWAEGGMWRTAILGGRDDWNRSSAGVNITTTTASEPHTIHIDSFPGVTWDGIIAIGTPVGQIVATQSRMLINTVGPLRLGSTTAGGRTVAQQNRLRRAVVTHEIGHLLWLGDNPTRGSNRSIMHREDVLANTSSAPSAFDARNVRFRYGG